MRAPWAIVLIFPMLAACGDPLADVGRVSEGATFPEVDAPNALPTQEELDRQSSILAGLFRRRDSGADLDSPDIPSVGESAGESGVAPETDVATNIESAGSSNADQPVAQGAPPQRRTVLGWLRRAAEAGAENPAPAQDVDGQELLAKDETTEALPEETELASLTPDGAGDDAPTVPVEAKKQIGLFEREAPLKSAGMALPDIAMGTILPFGEIGRLCDARTGDLGKQIDRAARKGAGYALYDSAPNSEGARSFYVTGFADGCVRQFTAALAIFGAPAFHEQLRYGLPAKDYPYSTTDKAYEKVKAEVCNVGRNRPCGARISRLEDTTVFISVYEHFGDNARWADMLLHDGALLAAAVKTP